MSDKNFMQHNTKIVSASPYRAVVRRQDPPYQLQQTSRDDSDDEDDNEADINEEFERDHDPLDIGAAADVYMQGQDHPAGYPPFGEKLASGAETFGENVPAAQTPSYMFNNLEQTPGLSSSDGKEAAKDASLYSYSKVSNNLKEESFMMRQLRDQ